MVGVVPVGFASVLLTVGKGSEVGMLRNSVCDAGVECQHKAVGAAHLAVGRGGVRHGRDQSGEVAAADLGGDALGFGVIMFGVALQIRILQTTYIRAEDIPDGNLKD